MRKVAWGLDLAGFSSSKQGLARAERKDDKTIHITIYKKHIFSKKIKKVDTEAKVCNLNLTKRINCLKNITPLFVDVPIDNTYLESVYKNNPRYIWQLNLRPADRAYKGQKPFGSLMGGYVQQFKYMHNESKLTLDNNLYETYPAASLIELGIVAKYKKTISVYRKNEWTTSIGGICNKLNITPINNTKLKINDDEIDAVLCALCGVVSDDHTLKGSQLDEHITTRINNGITYKAPKGYVLLQLPEGETWPYTIEIEKVDLSPLDESNTT